MIAHREDYHVRPHDVIPVGLAAAAGMFAILLGLIVLWMRGSSRGHRVIVESALVLLLGLPVTGIQIVGDTNRALDDAPSERITRAVQQCEAERRGPDLPRSIETTRDVCRAAYAHGEIELEIGPGRWRLPWFRRIHAGDVTWTAP